MIVGARRTPPVPCPKGNTNTAVSVLPSVGFQQLDAADYAAAVEQLRPDIVVGLGDIVHNKQHVSSNRIGKMGDRTGSWMTALVQACEDGSREQRTPLIFAPILPVPSDMQSYYLNQLCDGDLRSSVSGLAIYDAATMLDVPSQLGSMPRLAFTEPPGPAQLLHEISLGIDMFTLPFIGAATDAGIALGFEFPAPAQINGSARTTLGTNMWLTEHALDVSSLAAECDCYACRKHHRAYVHHLLSAKEMLAWVLLQVHNHHIVDRFFNGVRHSIAKDTFEEDKRAFEKYYEPELPSKTGEGPRVRGYQFKSEGKGEPKKNPKAYGRLDDAKEKFAEGIVPNPDINAKDLENAGLGSIVQ